MDLKHSLQNLLARSKAFDPALQQFMSVDRDLLEKESELKARAEKQGKANIPKTVAKKKDALATEIDLYLTEVLRRGKDELQNHLSAIGELGSSVSRLLLFSFID